MSRTKRIKKGVESGSKKLDNDRSPSGKARTSGEAQISDVWRDYRITRADEAMPRHGQRAVWTGLTSRDTSTSLESSDGYLSSKVPYQLDGPPKPK